MPNIQITPAKGLQQVTGDGGTLLGQRIHIKPKTSSYTVTNADLSGTLFTTSGSAGDRVNFTLPVANANNKGVYYDFFNQVNANMGVTGSRADTLVVHNDNAADSIGFCTANEKVGAAVRCVSDGNAWLVFPMTEETTTMTVGT